MFHLRKDSNTKSKEKKTIHYLSCISECRYGLYLHLRTIPIKSSSFRFIFIFICKYYFNFIINHVIAISFTRGTSNYSHPSHWEGVHPSILHPPTITARTRIPIRHQLSPRPTERIATRIATACGCRHHGSNSTIPSHLTRSGSSRAVQWRKRYSNAQYRAGADGQITSLGDQQ